MINFDVFYEFLFVVTVIWAIDVCNEKIFIFFCKVCNQESFLGRDILLN